MGPLRCATASRSPPPVAEVLRQRSSSEGVALGGFDSQGPTLENPATRPSEGVCEELPGGGSPWDLGPDTSNHLSQQLCRPTRHSSDGLPLGDLLVALKADLGFFSIPAVSKKDFFEFSIKKGPSCLILPVSGERLFCTFGFFFFVWSRRRLRFRY